jgi:heme-degrading monooxygenase HmoA
MFAVIFEVQPKKERFDDYLNFAKTLKPELEKIDGFIDNERFGSKRTEGRLLSLSTWRDEKAVIRWRTQSMHHAVQEKGRFEVFADYHLRVGEIVADNECPKDQTLQELRFDETEVGKAKAVTISELSHPSSGKSAGEGLSSEFGFQSYLMDGIIDHEIFESITNQGKMLLLISWRDAKAATNWQPGKIAESTPRHRLVRVIRDYGMDDRREAPQYYPSVEPINRPV